MKLFSISNHRLPGISGFLKRNPMFRIRVDKSKPGAKEIVKETLEALRKGNLRSGEQFPTPGQISDLTGAKVTDSLEAVTTLMKSGALRQNSSGRLSISPFYKG